MSEPEKEEEPSMEEILASIRRIISEDDEKLAKEPAPEPEPEKDAEPAEEEDVLELTEDDLEEDELVLEDEPEEEPEPEPESEPEVEQVASAPAMDMGIDDVDPALDEDALVSSEAGDNIMGQFDALSALLTTGYQGSGNTLEDLVRELLRPMLKEWLDAYLPEIAERMVANEIARLARTKKP
jgi:cell pole-organizing protein PopZ